jgi:hypothetical protein
LEDSIKSSALSHALEKSGVMLGSMTSLQTQKYMRLVQQSKCCLESNITEQYGD